MGIASQESNLSQLLELIVEHNEDFLSYTSGGQFTTVKDTAPTAAAGATATCQSELQLDTGTTDNDEVYVGDTNLNFRFANNRPLTGVCRALATAVAAANYIVGFSSTRAADTLVDNGGGPPANYTGAVFFKVDGGANWNVEFSNGTTQTTVELTAANSRDGVAKPAAASYQKFGVRFEAISATLANVDFFIDDVHVYHMAGVSYTAANVGRIVGAKAGSTAGGQTLAVDYFKANQPR